MIYQNTLLAHGTVEEALRPRRSGVAQDAHTIQSSKEPVTDYEKMRLLIEGARVDIEKDSARTNER